MGYEFDKLYADLVSPDGTVCVVTLTWVRLLGGWQARAGVELYWPDGRREVLPAEGAPALTGPDPLLASPLRLDLPDGPFELSLEDAHGEPWEPSEPAPCGSLEWSVRVARASARATWGDRELIGSGYADWVRLTRFTRRLHFSSLEWGRIHLPDRTVVFNLLTLQSGEQWRVCRVWSDRERDCPDIRLELDEGAGDVSIGEALIRLQPVRVLFAGDAFDAQRVPHRMDRLACWAIGGRTTQTRWISRASMDEAPAGWALHELVHFG